MKALIAYSLVLIYSCFGWTASAQSWPCDGDRYVSLNDIDPPTRIYKIDDDGPNFVLNLVQEYEDLAFNAMGYNVVDGFIYAINEDGSIVRLKPDGTYDIVGRDPQLFIRGAVAGDVDREGRYVVQDRRANTINIYNVMGTFSKVRSIPMIWAENTQNTGRADFTITDFVFHPQLPRTLISHQKYNDGPNNTKGYVLFINIDENSPDVGKVYPQFRIPSSLMSGFGALFFDHNERLFAYGTDNLNTGGHYKLYEIDLQQQSATHLSDGPIGNGVDGCSCPKSMELHKIIDSVKVSCDSTEVFYRLRVINRSSLVKSGLQIADSIQRGGWLHVRKFLSQNPGIFWSVSGRNIAIRLPDIQGSDSLDIIFSVSVSNDMLPFENQAFLRGVWAESDVAIPSDDPSTSEFPDATLLREDDLDFSEVQHYITESYEICDGDTLVIQNTPIFAAGEYTFPLNSGERCDTLLIANVEALESFATKEEFAVCSGDTLDFFGQKITSSGSYQEVLQASNSCDSIIEWSVRFEDTIRAKEELVLCAEDTIYFKGLILDAVGQYSVWVPGTKCDTFWEIDVIPPPDVSPVIQAIATCEGQENGRLELSFDTGTILNWKWENDGNQLIRDGLSSGTYLLTFEDSYGCWSDTAIQLTMVERPRVNINVEPLDCHNDFTGRLEVDLSDADSISLNSGPFVLNSDFGIQQEGLQGIRIKKGHCAFEDSVDVPIIPLLDFDIKSRTSGGCLDEVSIQILLSDGDFSKLDTLYLLPEPQETVTDENNITFPLTGQVSSIITVIDSHGCQYTEPIEVGLEGEGTLFVPNVFTPNGDNLNDIFTVYTSPCIIRVELLEVYDRWGEMVFHATDFLPEEDGWDGQLNGKTMDLGVYTWRLVFVGHNDKALEKSGSVTLLK